MHGAHDDVNRASAYPAKGQSATGEVPKLGLRDLWEPQCEVPGATTAADTIYRVSPLDDPVPTETREFGFVDPDLREDPMAQTRTHRTGRQPRLGP